MDPLRRDDIARARAASASDKAKQALEAMATGFRLKRAALRARFPHASEKELDELFRVWLERDRP